MRRIVHDSINKNVDVVAAGAVVLTGVNVGSHRFCRITNFGTAMISSKINPSSFHCYH